MNIASRSAKSSEVSISKDENKGEKTTDVDGPMKEGSWRKEDTLDA